MSANSSLTSTHPEGEISNNNLSSSDEPILCDTFDGLVHVEWEPQASVTPVGKLVFFTQFLKTCNLYEEWVQDCPLEYKSPNAPSKRNVLGTLLLAVLSGQTRYSHVTTIRQDGVNPSLLGMTKVLSEDAVRRAFQNVDTDECKKWQQKHLKKCYEPLLEEEWILDVDATIKLLYGHQEGAKVSYNPTKPGRPSHIIHTYSMAETRVILDCELLAGNQHPSCYAMPRLLEIIDELPPEKRPRLVRGDCAFGNENIISPLEQSNIPYLFKLKQTKKVRNLTLLANCSDKHWVDAGGGWEGVESSIRLTGWTNDRRVIILRRPLKEKKRGAKPKGQQIQFPFLASVSNSNDYEYAILVTSLNYGVSTIAQLYRDRATSENHFDELKNQWGWGGFVTQDLKRSQIMARVTAQAYNWWTLFVRWVEPDKHAEAVTSRPLMLYGVARATNHAGQKTLHVTSMHGASEKVCKKMNLIASVLQKIKAFAEQFNVYEIWKRILSMIFSKFLKGRILGEGRDGGRLQALLKLCSGLQLIGQGNT